MTALTQQRRAAYTLEYRSDDADKVVADIQADLDREVRRFLLLCAQIELVLWGPDSLDAFSLRFSHFFFTIPLNFAGILLDVVIEECRCHSFQII